MSRRVAVVVASVAVVLGAAALVWWWTSTADRASAPRDVAQVYLTALEQGDIDTIHEVRRGSLSPLAIDAFAGADHIVDPRIDDVVVDGDEGAVTASAELAGERRPLQFAVIGDSDGWKVAGDDLGELSASTTPGAAVTMGDAVVEADTVVDVLPAVYPVVAVPEEVLSGRTDAAITPQQTVHVVVETELAAGAVDAVQRAVDAWAEACTVSAQSVPASCGFDVPWPADFTSIASIDYRIDAYPSVTGLGVDGVLVASDGVLVATVRGQARDGDEPRTYRTDDWMMRGAITFEGAQLVIRAF